jgi:flavin reductase (DIM6/NTAB) family NADH-FMN oxidoreductase RutF
VVRNSPYVRSAIVEAMVGLLAVRTPSLANVMTVSFVSEVAHHPTTLWVSIDRSTYTHELLRSVGQFSLAMLHDGQADVAWACGTVSGRERDKCSSLGLEPRTDFLFLPTALTNTACRTRATVDLGTHTLFIADLLSGEVNSHLQGRRNLLLSDL